jgi:hypothetical protein
MGHGSEKVTDHPTGGLTVTMTLNNLEEVNPMGFEF